MRYGNREFRNSTYHFPLLLRIELIIFGPPGIDDGYASCLARTEMFVFIPIPLNDARPAAQKTLGRH